MNFLPATTTSGGLDCTGLRRPLERIFLAATVKMPKPWLSRRGFIGIRDRADAGHREREFPAGEARLCSWRRRVLYALRSIGPEGGDLWPRPFCGDLVERFAFGCPGNRSGQSGR